MKMALSPVSIEIYKDIFGQFGQCGKCTIPEAEAKSFLLPYDGASFYSHKCRRWKNNVPSYIVDIMNLDCLYTQSS